MSFRIVHESTRHQLTRCRALVRGTGLLEGQLGGRNENGKWVNRQQSRKHASSGEYPTVHGTQAQASANSVDMIVNVRVSTGSFVVRKRGM
jgi:hypothetical protein